VTGTGGATTTVAVTGIALTQVGTVAGATAAHFEPNAAAVNVSVPSGKPDIGKVVLAPTATSKLVVTVRFPVTVTWMHVPSGGASVIARLAVPTGSPGSDGPAFATQFASATTIKGPKVAAKALETHRSWDI
jgi:hypothetical protein